MLIDLLSITYHLLPKTLATAKVAGNASLVKQIMDACTKQGGRRFVEIIVDRGTMDLFQEILSWGVTLDPRDPFCCKALLQATSRGQTEIVSLFLQHGFDVNGSYRTEALGCEFDSDDDYDPYDDFNLYRNTTLLIHCATPWNPDEPGFEMSKTMELLLHQGAKVDAVGSKGRTTLAEVAKRGGNISLAKLLIERGADPLKGASGSESALEWAILGNHPRLVELFLETITTRGQKAKGLIPIVLDFLSDPYRER
jgi:ankyrin repeat protein